MAIVTQELTESKRRVLTLLNTRGPQTKRALAASAGLGWATIVKVINQLIDDRVVVRAGISPRERARKGRDSYLYALTNDRPLAIGLDVEYRTTRIILTNLAGTVLHQDQAKTPQDREYNEVLAFFVSLVTGFIARHGVRRDSLAGVGIGVPGINFPSRHRQDNHDKTRSLESDLAAALGVDVRIQNNTKAYTVFEKWINSRFDYADFVFVSIRTGIGSGIIIGGNLYTGSHGLAGEIGHMKVVPNGLPCRCGGNGCMETVANENYLFQQYRAAVLQNGGPYMGEDQQALFDGLSDLFARARRGEPAAERIVDTAAGYLGHCLAHAIMTLDVTNIIVSGHFGPEGDIIVAKLCDVIRENVLPGMGFNVAYCPFDESGHTRGAALLVLKDYFVDMP